MSQITVVDLSSSVFGKNSGGIGENLFADTQGRGLTGMKEVLAAIACIPGLLINAIAEHVRDILGFLGEDQR